MDSTGAQAQCIGKRLRIDQPVAVGQCDLALLQAPSSTERDAVDSQPDAMTIEKITAGVGQVGEAFAGEFLGYTEQHPIASQHKAHEGASHIAGQHDMLAAFVLSGRAAVIHSIDCTGVVPTDGCQRAGGWVSRITASPRRAPPSAGVRWRRSR